MAKRKAASTKSRKKAESATDELLLHPLRFTPVERETIWGGDVLQRKLNKPFKKTATIGESWEISDREEGMSVVAEGDLKGQTFRDLIFNHPEEMLGTDYGLKYRRKFPLLVKLLHCQDFLSVQVHPSDEFAKRFEKEETGKMEAWYILDCPKGAKIYRGILPGTTEEEFRRLIEEDKIMECLNEVDVAPGDVVFIPPGTVHTAGEGITIFEISQNCDTTYRLHDFGRKRLKPKQAALQLEKGLRMIDFYSMGISKIKPIPVKDTPRAVKRKILLKGQKFSIESLILNKGTAKIEGHSDSFRMYMSIGGKGSFKYGPKLKQSMKFKEFEVWMIPAAVGDYEIKANGKLEMLDMYL